MVFSQGTSIYIVRLHYGVYSINNFHGDIIVNVMMYSIFIIQKQRAFTNEDSGIPNSYVSSFISVAMEKVEQELHSQ